MPYDPGMDAHRLAERRSLAMHAEIARRLCVDPGVLERGCAPVEEWARSGAAAAPYVAAWRRVLALPVEALCAFLVDPDEAARALRQVTPFAGVLGARERWRIWRAAATEPR